MVFYIFSQYFHLVLKLMLPGRLNQVSSLIQRTGVYYGQYSEIYGLNHGLMPIELPIHSPYTV